MVFLKAYKSAIRHHAMCSPPTHTSRRAEFFRLGGPVISEKTAPAHTLATGVARTTAHRRNIVQSRPHEAVPQRFEPTVVDAESGLQ